jgi:hypothetical protein
MTVLLWIILVLYVKNRHEKGDQPGAVTGESSKTFNLKEDFGRV